MKKNPLQIIFFCLTTWFAATASAQIWTKVSGIADSAQSMSLGMIDDQIVLGAHNWTNSAQVDFFSSPDGNVWTQSASYPFASFDVYGLPKNKLLLNSSLIGSKKFVSNAWETFNANGYAYAEFEDGTLIGGHSSFPTQLFRISAAGVAGEAMGTATFQIGAKFCNGSNNRLFLFSNAGMIYIDLANPAVHSVPATLDGKAITQNDLIPKFILDMVKAKDGTLFAASSIGGILKSSDNGVGWTTVNAMGSDGPLSIAINSADHLYIRVGSAQFRKSTDGGVTFTNINGNLPALGFKREILVNSKDEVFAFVNANGGVRPEHSGIFKLEGSIGIQGNKGVRRNAFRLQRLASDNRLSIERVHGAESAGIQITDVAGKVLFSKPIRNAKTQVNLAGFAKGLYFVALKSGNRIEVQRFLVE